MLIGCCTVTEPSSEVSAQKEKENIEAIKKRIAAAVVGLHSTRTHLIASRPSLCSGAAVFMMPFWFNCSCPA